MKAFQHSISAHYPAALLRAAEQLGLEPTALLAAGGLNKTLLTSGQLRVTPRQFSSMMQCLWQVSNDEWMGLAADQAKCGLLVLMAEQALQQRNLREVYRYIGRFYSLVGNSLSLELSETGQACELRLQLANPRRDPDKLLLEFMLLLLHRFPSWLLGQRIPLLQANFIHSPPEHSSEYRLLFPCQSHFDQTNNSLVFDSECLNWPVIQSRQALKHYLRQSPYQLFTRQAYFPVFTRQLIDYLSDLPSGDSGCIEQFARSMSMTSRTLRRKLTCEGTSFQQLKDQVRRDRAIDYLSDPNLKIADIAQQLGFSEPAAFSRAFTQWTGVSPSAYKQR